MVESGAMKRLWTWGLPTFLIVASVTYWYSEINADDAPQHISALEQVGDECELIADKAAMHLPEALPFQKLEKSARKARVLEQCMHDRAYIENPAWLKFAQPIAQKNAQTQHVSENEAYETLRRKAMYSFKPTKSDKSTRPEPAYWLASQGVQ